MKKIIVLCTLMSLVCAGSAFAVAADTALLAAVGDAGKALKISADGEVIGKTSKGVRIGVQFNATSYALTSVHINGSKYYGTAFDSTAIWTTTPAGDIGAAFTAPATSVTQTAFDDTGWSTL